MTTEPNIKLTGVAKIYGTTPAVKAVDLAVAPGECLALVGHNGAGKSTLIKMVLGLVQPSSGEISVMGLDPQAPGFHALRKDIGFLPEQVLFQNNMTGRETLSFYARLKGAPLDSLDDLFHKVDLFAAADQRISTYSKGMRQRLGLAQALIGSPKLLILDEPTSGLDPVSRQNVYGIINAAKRDGATVLISSHALTELDARIDRVAILSRGDLVALGRIADLRRNIGLASDVTLRAAPDVMAKLAQHFDGVYSPDHFINGTAILPCAPDQKVEFLRELVDLNLELSDIVVHDPSLEEVFMAYSRGAGGEKSHG